MYLPWKITIIRNIRLKIFVVVNTCGSIEEPNSKYVFEKGHILTFRRTYLKIFFIFSLNSKSMKYPCIDLYLRLSVVL